MIKHKCFTDWQAHERALEVAFPFEVRPSCRQRPDADFDNVRSHFGPEGQGGWDCEESWIDVSYRWVLAAGRVYRFRDLKDAIYCKMLLDQG